MIAMTKSELILKIGELNPHLYQRDVERIVSTIFDEISAALARIVELPLYLVVLGSLLVGFLVGGAIAWLSAGRRRHEARVTAERLRGMSAELTRLKRQQPAGLDGSTARLPAPR